MQKCDVLIAGAGPTGLVLALWLTRLGVRARIVDKAAEPGQTSRAVGVQARTLELYRQMDLDRHLVDGGLRAVAANFWVKGVHEGRVPFGEMGQGLSPFPYMLVYPQDRHERWLIERLAAMGVRVERPSELLDLKDAGGRVTASLKNPDGAVDACEADYVAGCDGARSTVRQALHIEYPGGTYAHVFYVADVEASGPAMNGELHVAMDESDFLACFPLQGHSRARLIGTVRPEAEGDGKTLDWSAIGTRAVDRMKLDVTRVNWFSTYRVHHRVASSFRAGRVFLLGDAAHVHSPVGGQGMNTGIGDAINLAWKLAAALHGHAPAQILESYEEERMPFARRLVRTTDRIFELVSAEGRLANRLRLGVAPRVIGTVLRSARVRKWMFDVVSQIQINYRNARLSEGRAGRVHGGDRLPWVAYEGGTDNFDPLRSLTWQAHVYGDADEALKAACKERRLPLHVLPWASSAERAGLARDALFLLRPDGYVALAHGADHAQHALAQYLDQRSLSFDDAGRV